MRLLLSWWHWLHIYIYGSTHVADNVADMPRMLLIRFECCRFALKASPKLTVHNDDEPFIGLKLDGPKLGGPLTTEIEQDDIERSLKGRLFG